MGFRTIRVGMALVAAVIASVVAAPQAFAGEPLAKHATPSVADIRGAIPPSSFTVPDAIADLAKGQAQVAGDNCYCDSCGCCPCTCNPCCKRLRFSLTLVGWLSGMDGTSTTRGRETAVDLPWYEVPDIFDKIDEILQGNVAVSYGKWALRFGLTHLKLSDSTEFTQSGLTAQMDVKTTFYQIVLEYNVANGIGPNIGCCCSKLRYDVYAGVRFADLELGIDLPLPSVRASQAWEDPIVGGRVTWDMRNKWVLDAEFDIGGFGVSSDLTWSARLGARYQIARWFGVVAGWKWLDYDYATGSGTSRFAWDITMSGPYFGLHFRF